MNLTEANLFNRTNFYDEYNARDAFELSNLYPVDWDEFLQRLEKDIDGPLMNLVQKYHRKSSGVNCNHNCRRNLLCTLKTARFEDPHACDSIPPFNSNV